MKTPYIVAASVLLFASCSKNLKEQESDTDSTNSKVLASRNYYVSPAGSDGQDAHSINKEPLFLSVNDYHLQAGSPSRNVADVSVIKDATQLDKDGLLLLNKGVSSMGAYQQ